MTHSQPTLPLIREAASLPPHHSLLEGRVNAAIFGGWGIRVLGSRVL
ncbi:MAG: hypothetical protein NVS9B12_08300 [Vulcanimicrobiaceae bacterium]